MDRSMWDADRPVTPEMVAEEVGVDLETHRIRLDSVDYEHVDMVSSYALASSHNAEAELTALLSLLEAGILLERTFFEEM